MKEQVLSDTRQVDDDNECIENDQKKLNRHESIDKQLHLKMSPSIKAMESE